MEYNKKTISRSLNKLICWKVHRNFLLQSNLVYLVKGQFSYSNLGLNAFHKERPVK